MAKKKPAQPAKTCADCIHEHACVAWTVGGRMAAGNAVRCPNYETAKDSAAYLIGKLDAAGKHDIVLCRYCAHAEIYGDRVVCRRAPGAAFTVNSFCSEGVMRE